MYLPKLVKTIGSQKGKVVVITGTSSGTGLEAARVALAKEAKVYVLNRVSKKSEDAFAKLKSEFPEATVEQIECDLMDFESVKAAARKLISAEEENGIDVLCNNAGVMALGDKATKDGYDVQMQTNHLSHFLLTKEIYPLLVKAAERTGEARVVNHSSRARLGKALEEKYFGPNGGKLGGDGASYVLKGANWVRYQQTKLAALVFSMEMQRRLDAAGSKVIAVCAHPGVAATALAESLGSMALIFKYLGQRPEDGACGIVRCMFGEDVEKGAFYGPGTKGMKGAAIKADPGPHTDEANGKLLWEASEKACGEFAL